MTFKELKIELDQLDSLKRTNTSLRKTNQIQNDIIDRLVGNRKDVIVAMLESLNHSLSTVTSNKPTDYDEGVASGLTFAIEIIKNFNPKK